MANNEHAERSMDPRHTDRDRPWTDPETLGRVWRSCTVDEACDRLGCSVKTLYKWAERFGLHEPGRDTPWRDEEVMVELYERQGMSTTEIADHLGCGTGTAGTWAKEFGLTDDYEPASGEGHPSYVGGQAWRQSSRWKRARRAVFERDDSRCQSCGTLGAELDDPLHAHHIVPVSEGGPKYRLDNMMTLCHDCHEQAHGHPIPRSENGGERG